MTTHIPGPVYIGSDVRCLLGEGPTWDDRNSVARWVDIDVGHLWEAPVDTTGVGLARKILDCGPALGAAVHTADGGLLLARTRHIEHRDAAGSTVTAARIISEDTASRLNDAACDPAGRLLVGSLAIDGRVGGERLWRIEHTGDITVIDDDLTLSNGLAWSPDGALFYSIDSVPGTVCVRDYNPIDGTTGPRRPLIDIRDGVPDGLTVDADGNLWVALWGPGEVRCYTPQGQLQHVVSTGAPLTTSVCFAGPDLDLLLMTTAGKAADGAVHTERSGALLAGRPGVVGQPTTAWQPAPLATSTQL